MKLIDKAYFAEALRQFLHDQKLTQDAFGVPLGWANSRVSRYLSQKHGQPRQETIDAILQVHPAFADYLKPNDQAKEVELDVMPVKLVTRRDYGKYPSEHEQTIYIYNLDTIYVAKEFEAGNYLVFEIQGNSMDDGKRHSICEGDRVLCKELPQKLWHTLEHLEPHLYVIVTSDQICCKEIISQKDGILHCKSFNPMFDDVKIHISKVSQIFYIKKIVERVIKLK